MSDTGVDDASIWQQHKEELVRYATVLVGSDQAEDVLSSVIVRILRRPGGLLALDAPRPYLFKSVLNESRDRLRFRDGRAPWSESIVLPPDVRPEVIDAVGELPPRQRAAVYLRYWRDLPVAEVADLMGCTPGAVKRYLHIARKRLQGVLEP